MGEEIRSCEGCTSGCTGRHTPDRTGEEVRTAPYLVIAGVLIIVFSLIIRWLI